MDIKEIRKKIKEIPLDDAEYAHRDEDKLRDDVLKAIARGVDNPKALAREVLKTSNIKFSRWYA